MIRVLGVRGREEVTLKMVVDAIKILEKRGVRGTFFLEKEPEKLKTDYGTISDNHITFTVKGKPALFETLGILGKDAVFIVCGSEKRFGIYPVISIDALENSEQLADFIMERGFILPGLDCGACGEESCEKMMEKIVARERKPEECGVLSSNVVVTCGGKKLPINPFVAKIIASTIRGLLSPLKGYEEGEIKIRIGSK